jgi:RNA polymerase sigma-70 factor (ECF subfamily)
MMDARSTFEAVAMPCLESLYRTALRMVHDEAAAARCIEQTFLEARSRVPRIPGVTDLRVWMFSILFRKLRLHPVRTPRPVVPDQDEVLDALDRIPAIFREVLLLADVEGFRRSEIEAILLIPTELVKGRLTEGRDRLRHALQPGGPHLHSAENRAIAHGEL